MKICEVLLLQESDMSNGHIKQSLGGDRVMWKATQVVLTKNDGTTKVLKDRWGHPSNPGNVKLAFPSSY